MKFSNGNWTIKNEIIFNQKLYARDIIADKNSITAFAPDRPYKDKGSTLNGQLLTVKYSTPIKNVIKIEMFHHLSSEKNNVQFDLNSSQTVTPKISQTHETASLKSGNLEVFIDKADKWNALFKYKNINLTNSNFKRSGIFHDQKKVKYICEGLAIDPDEKIYGFGERYTEFTKNGQTVDIWNVDEGTATDKTYKNIPFYLSSKGYGVFVNDPGKVSFEVGSEFVNYVEFSIPGNYLEYYIIAGEDLKDVLTNYTALTGKPSLPPAWSFGLWLTTSFLTDYGEDSTTKVIDKMQSQNIPLKVFHYDCFWMKEYHWCDFEWDSDVFPDPENMIKRIKKKNLKICVWINPYIAQRSKLFQEGKEKGFFLKKKNGELWQTDNWQSGMSIVDFTNPEACSWYQSKLQNLINMGVDSFKTDFGEEIPTDCVYYDNSDPGKMHNLYTYLYNKVVFELLEKNYEKNNAVLFARSATAGSQKFPVHWGGDNSATYSSMAESLRGGLSLSCSGFGFWSHDIGGFEGTPTPDLYKRWIAFGLLSSHSRLHGAHTYRVPWIFDKESVRVLEFFTKLKCKLMPYIYSNAYSTSQNGHPLMRPMIMEFMEDRNCHPLGHQYMLGESLLIAPVFNNKGIVTFYIPKGEWIDLLTAKRYKGEKWYSEKIGYFNIPILMRENKIIPIGNQINKPDYNYENQICFNIFSTNANTETSFQLVSVKNEILYTIRFKADQTKILIMLDHPRDDFSIKLLNYDFIYKSADFKIIDKKRYCLLYPKKKSDTFEIIRTGRSK